MTGIQHTQILPAANSRANNLFRLSMSILLVIAAAIGPLWPFSLVNGAGFHDNQRILEVFCVLMSGLFGIAFLIMNRDEKVRRLYDRHLMFFFALFFVLGFVSSIIAYSPRHALFEWANFLLLGIMCLLIASEMRAKGDALLDKVLLLCGVGAAFYIFIEIIVYIAAISAGAQPANELLIRGFDNFRFFNHVQTTTLPLLGLLAVRSNERWKKVFSWIVLSMWWTLFFLTVGRGTFVGLLAGMSVTIVFLRRDALPWCKVMMYSALLGMGLYFLFYVLIPISQGLRPFGFLFVLVGRTVADPTSLRLPLWIRAWEILAAHPWLGAGPMHFAHFGRAVQNGAHPHNWVLQIACEWGIPAFLSLVATLALGFKKLLATRRYLAPADKQNRLILAAWLTTGIAILVDGLVSGLFVMPSSQLWIALYIGCAWGWICSVTPVQAEATMRLSVPMRIGGVAGLLLLIYFLGNGLWPEILNLPLHEEQNLQREIYADPIMHPRTWLGGYF